MHSPTHYGIELVINASGCDPSLMTREKLAVFIEQLCERIDMKRALEPYFWDEINGGSTPEPHLKGVSVFQFIETSNIAIHALTMLEVIFLNIFSCKPFEQKAVEKFVKEYFKAQHVESKLIERTYVARLREKS
ncbi:MAG: S-adenosylmethionine decarboxylase [Candidatus Andersenbacteria bacterium]